MVQALAHTRYRKTLVVEEYRFIPDLALVFKNQGFFISKNQIDQLIVSCFSFLI